MGRRLKPCVREVHQVVLPQGDCVPQVEVDKVFFPRLRVQRSDLAGRTRSSSARSSLGKEEEYLQGGAGLRKTCGEQEYHIAIDIACRSRWVAISTPGLHRHLATRIITINPRMIP